MTGDVSASPQASPWVERFSALIPVGGAILDLACGSGRHSRFLAAKGYRVTAVDRNAVPLADLSRVDGVTVLATDLEGDSWPLVGESYSGVVVTNYLYRPRLDDVLAVLATPGVLIYETFMFGNARYGKPSNADFLLQPQELLNWAQRGGLRIVAFEEGYVERPKPAMVQRLCAVRGEFTAAL